MSDAVVVGGVVSAVDVLALDVVAGALLAGAVAAGVVVAACDVCAVVDRGAVVGALLVVPAVVNAATVTPDPLPEPELDESAM